MKADKNLFGIITVISQSRNLDVKEVSSHQLCPIPWSFSNTLEELSSPAEDIPNDSACIIDAMNLVQNIKGNHKTFKEIAEALFGRIMAESAPCSRVDVVFDVYRDKSINNAERKTRGNADATQYKYILPTQKIKQWHQFIKSSHNKANLI